MSRYEIRVKTPASRMRREQKMNALRGRARAKKEPLKMKMLKICAPLLLLAGLLLAVGGSSWDAHLVASSMPHMWVSVLGIGLMLGGGACITIVFAGDETKD